MTLMYMLPPPTIPLLFLGYPPICLFCTCYPHDASIVYVTPMMPLLYMLPLHDASVVNITHQDASVVHVTPHNASDVQVTPTTMPLLYMLPPKMTLLYMLPPKMPLLYMLPLIMPLLYMLPPPQCLCCK